MQLHENYGISPRRVVVLAGDRRTDKLESFRRIEIETWNSTNWMIYDIKKEHDYTYGKWKSKISYNENGWNFLLDETAISIESRQGLWENYHLPAP